MFFKNYFNFDFITCVQLSFFSNYGIAVFVSLKSKKALSVETTIVIVANCSGSSFKHGISNFICIIWNSESD
ncbi:hypothetical protein D3C80_1919960 [compost metagenome]